MTRWVDLELTAAFVMNSLGLWKVSTTPPSCNGRSDQVDHRSRETAALMYADLLADSARLIDRSSQTVYNAIRTGYRLLDGAGDYGNEKEAGEGVRRALAEGIVKRDELCKSPMILSSVSDLAHRLQSLHPRLEKLFMMNDLLTPLPSFGTLSTRATMQGVHCLMHCYNADGVVTR